MISDTGADAEAAMLDLLAEKLEIVDRIVEIVADVAAQIPAGADLDRHIFRRFLDEDGRTVVGTESRYRPQHRGRERQEQARTAFHGANSGSAVLAMAAPSLLPSMITPGPRSIRPLLTIVVKCRLRITGGCRAGSGQGLRQPKRPPGNPGRPRLRSDRKVYL